MNIRKIALTTLGVLFIVVPVSISYFAYQQVQQLEEVEELKNTSKEYKDAIINLDHALTTLWVERYVSYLINESGEEENDNDGYVDINDLDVEKQEILCRDYFNLFKDEIPLNEGQRLMLALNKDTLSGWLDPICEQFKEE
jgi:hypothetical protein